MPKDYSKKNLQKASFKNENLSYALFSSSDLRGADFSGSDLTGADFTHVRTGLPWLPPLLSYPLQMSNIITTKGYGTHRLTEAIWLHRHP